MSTMVISSNVIIEREKIPIGTTVKIRCGDGKYYGYSVARSSFEDFVVNVRHQRDHCLPLTLRMADEGNSWTR